MFFSQGCGQIMQLKWWNGLLSPKQDEPRLLLCFHTFFSVSVPAMHSHLSFGALIMWSVPPPVRNWAPQEQVPNPSSAGWGRENSKSEKLVHLKSDLNPPPLESDRHWAEEWLKNREGKGFAEGFSSAGSCTSTPNSVLSSWGSLSPQHLLILFLLPLAEFSHWGLGLD